MNENMSKFLAVKFSSALKKFKRKEGKNIKPMNSRNNYDPPPRKKPDNIIWIEEVLLNNIEENGLPAASVESVPNTTSVASVNGSLSKNSSDNKSNDISSSFHSKVSSKTSSGSPHSQQSVLSLPPTQNMSELKIGIAEIELKDESYLGDDRVHTLSRIVSGKIKYFIENVKGYEDEERYQYWIIKLPSLERVNRHLSQKMDVAQREIAFYTEMLPAMKSWVEAHNLASLIQFKVPTCFYGKYLRPVDLEPELDIIAHILDSESLLVLDDLRTMGFGKRHFGSGLLLSEVTAALEEIVKFHVTSWAMQTIDHKQVHNWQHLYSWKNLVRLYYTLLESCFSNIENYLRNTGHVHAHRVYTQLLKMRPGLRDKLTNLLMPDPESGINTLIHLDFWSDNIMFRMTEQDRENEVSVENANLECYILDWQLVTYGKPTHDVAQLIMLSMEPAARREHSTVLLQYYYELFKKTAGYFGLEMPIDFQTLKQEYKQSCVLATFMAMASIELVEMENTTQNRLMEALIDLIDENSI